MRKFILIFILLSNLSYANAQTEEESLAKIKEQFQWINTQQDYKVVDLYNEDYLEYIPDNGAQLIGYFKNDTLYKIVEWFEPSYAIMITEYYLWEEELFFVYDIEKNFRPILDSVGNFLELDYSIADTKYESRHYFVDEKEIKIIETGRRLMEIDYQQNFVINAKMYVGFLRKETQNKE